MFLRLQTALINDDLLNGGPARHQRAELRFDLTGEEADHSVRSDDHLLQAASSQRVPGITGVFEP